MLMCGVYDVQAADVEVVGRRTNKVPTGPYRGAGRPEAAYFVECTMDVAARELGVDPLELRRRNFMGERARTINELRVTSNGFMQCLDAVERASDWKSKHRRMPYGRGVGVAGSCYISGTNYPIYPNEMPQAAIQMQIERSGRISVLTGASEIGQGSDSVVAYIAAEELGVPLSYVRVISTDTDIVPVDLGAYSSRETFMVGNAAIDAARKLKRVVQEAVAERLRVALKKEIQRLGRMDPLGVKINILIGRVIVRLHHARRAKHFYTLIIPIDGFAAVVDGANGAIGKAKRDHRSIHIASLTDGRVHHHAGRRVHFLHFAATEIASHVEVMDRHVQEHSA